MREPGQDKEGLNLDKGRTGLGLWELGGVVWGSLLLTPLLGYGLAWGWRKARPKAALQALVITLVVSVLLGVLWMWLMRRSPS